MPNSAWVPKYIETQKNIDIRLRIQFKGVSGSYINTKIFEVIFKWVTLLGDTNTNNGNVKEDLFIWFRSSTTYFGRLQVCIYYIDHNYMSLTLYVMFYYKIPINQYATYLYHFLKVTLQIYFRIWWKVWKIF